MGKKGNGDEQDGEGRPENGCILEVFKWEGGDQERKTKEETGNNVDLTEGDDEEVKNKEMEDLIQSDNGEKEKLKEEKNNDSIATTCVEEKPQKERVGPILMFSTLGRNDEEYEEEEEEKSTDDEKEEDLTDEENEVKELEMELEELDSALQVQKSKDTISIADICHQLDEINEDEHENKVYDSFEEKLQNIFNIR